MVDTERRGLAVPLQHIERPLEPGSLEVPAVAGHLVHDFTEVFLQRAAVAGEIHRVVRHPTYQKVGEACVRGHFDAPTSRRYVAHRVEARLSRAAAKAFRVNDVKARGKVVHQVARRHNMPESERKRVQVLAVGLAEVEQQLL